MNWSVFFIYDKEREGKGMFVKSKTRDCCLSIPFPTNSTYAAVGGEGERPSRGRRPCASPRPRGATGPPLPREARMAMASCSMGSPGARPWRSPDIPCPLCGPFNAACVAHTIFTIAATTHLQRSARTSKRREKSSLMGFVRLKRSKTINLEANMQ